MSAATNDVMKVDAVIEINGVATVCGWHAVLANVPLGDEDNYEDALDKYAQDFWDQTAQFMSGQATLACMRLFNITQSERFVVYPGLTGTLADAHPTTCAVRIRRWADPVAPDTKRYVGGILLSGTAEEESVRGRLQREQDWDGVRNFFQTVRSFATPGGWDWVAAVRHDRTPPPSPTRDYVYGLCTHATVKGTFSQVRSRRTGLCAQV